MRISIYRILSVCIYRASQSIVSIPGTYIFVRTQNVELHSLIQLIASLIRRNDAAMNEA